MLHTESDETELTVLPATSNELITRIFIAGPTPPQNPLDYLFQSRNLGSQMSEKHEVTARNDTDIACQSELSAELNRRLDDAHQLAREQFESGQRAGGFGAVGRYFLTFLHTGLIKGKFLQGRRGLIACSVASQDAYNRAAMTYCIALQKK